MQLRRVIQPHLSRSISSHLRKIFLAHSRRAGLEPPPMEHTTPTSSVASLPDPEQDHPATIPSTNVEAVLYIVAILLGYGRHLIATVRQRATAPNFNAIAANFGTANVSTILAHLNRGILRCIALDRILRARAAAGRDIDFIERRTWTTLQPGPDPAEAAPPAQPAVAAPLPTRRHTPRPSRPAGWNDPELFMPTLEDLERQMRRRPIGRIIFDICLDLAVVPMCCHSAFWNDLFDIMNWFGGGTAVSRLMEEKKRRRAAFANEQDRNPRSNWDWMNMGRDKLREVLGFFIGEPPVNPLNPAAIATKPP
jgi:hypothetical protein